MPGEAALFQRVVQLAHAQVGFLVRGILGIEPHARLPEHEGEMPDVLREIGEGEMVRGDSAWEDRRPACHGRRASRPVWPWIRRRDARGP